MHPVAIHTVAKVVVYTQKVAVLGHAAQVVIIRPPLHSTGSGAGQPGIVTGVHVATIIRNRYFGPALDLFNHRPGLLVGAH